MKLELLLKSLEAYGTQFGFDSDVWIDFAADGKCYQGAICTVAVTKNKTIRLVSLHTIRNPAKDHLAIKAKNKEDLSDLCIIKSHTPPKIEVVKG